MGEPLRVLVVGQLPPPRHGQAVMLEQLLAGEYRGVQVHHVPLAFSRDLQDVGAFRPGKLLSLVTTIAAIVRARFRTGATVLYYPPAGPNWVPVLRDLAILSSTRWLFDKTVFHFHAGGLSTMLPRFPRSTRWLWKWAYSSPDVAIRLSRLAPADPAAIGARREVVLANGIEDPIASASRGGGIPREPGPTQILNLGLQSEEKGTLILVEAVRVLAEAGIDLELILAGAFESAEFRGRVEEFLDAHDLGGRVRLVGEVGGETKWTLFRDAGIFCFPTQHIGESFGLVLLEAFAFSVPVVASRWNATPEIVGEGECGLLFEAGDANDLARCLVSLVRDPEERERLGRNGRQRFLDAYTIEAHREGLQSVFDFLRSA